ncbi:PSD1 and planctomycete cytochrome C domain-containing protein [Planctomycetaceae bacterium SH139]
MLFAQAVAAPPEAGSAAELEFFEKQIRPLLAAHCLECHSGEEQAGGLRLDSRAAWQRGGDSGAAIVAGEPAASRLLEAVRYENLALQMPPSGKLSATEIAALETWIRGGAVDPRLEGVDPEATLSSGPQPTGMSIEDGRQFWSLRPLGDPTPPLLEADEWLQTPIDAFVLDKLQAAGIQPAPPADKRTLVRRITYDLIGLPPTPEEIIAFEQDDSPDAVAKLVDRLLESPHYGEQWGRHWLDVARYADSNGLDENLAFGNAWRYRDYVIEAFNQDKPFDQFVVEQIAGDLLPRANQETKTATGFLALGAKVLAEPDREKLAMDAIDEQIDTVGKAFLGMTLGCARCHDHKFDPIKHRDYYSLAAIFKSTRAFADTNTGAIKHWYEHDFATPAEEEKLKEVDAQIAAKNQAANSYKSQAMQAVRAQAEAAAAKYLTAASEFEPGTSLAEVQTIADRYGLHARILHHCRLHLAYHEEDPLVAKWLSIRDQDPQAIEDYFQILLHGDSASQQASDQQASAETGKTDDAGVVALREHARQALKDPSGFISVPPQPEFALDAETFARYDELMEEARYLESISLDRTAAMGVTDGPVVESLPIHIRGSHRNLGEPVSREFPEVMWVSQNRPVFPGNQSGRLELARWMASSQHPLTARVYVNRIWRWHFGRGIVGTTENFGRLGDRPTHPELLDWLARYFIKSGWSTKALHRLIMTSSVYQQDSVHPESRSAAAIDAENLLLWKFRLRRLQAEEIRDAILAVSGRLDLRMHGKMVPLRNRQFVFNHTSVDHTEYDSLRRAMYLPVVRNNIYAFFEQFDFPDPTTPTGSRHTTVVAPQALLLMNDELVMDSAEAFAAQIRATEGDLNQQITLAYEKALGRPPSNQEVDRAAEFLGIDTGSRWALFCQGLLASNEFIYLK